MTSASWARPTTKHSFIGFGMGVGGVAASMNRRDLTGHTHLFGDVTQFSVALLLGDPQQVVRHGRAHLRLRHHNPDGDTDLAVAVQPVGQVLHLAISGTRLKAMAAWWAYTTASPFLAEITRPCCCSTSGRRAPALADAAETPTLIAPGSAPRPVGRHAARAGRVPGRCRAKQSATDTPAR